MSAMDNGSGDYLGFFYGIVLFIGIIVAFFLLSVLIEALVFNRLGWGRYRRTLGYSSIANLISTIVMFLVGEQLGATVLGRDLNPLPLSLVMNGVIQVVVEVIVLLFIARRGVVKTLSHTLIANALSVAVLSGLIALLGCLV